MTASISAAMQTPPGTTLSTPSPTERQDPMIDDNTMAGRAKPIYLIVATAVNPQLGIGLKGSLPWGQISSDMTFFRKVTTGVSAKASSTGVQSLPNKVIMGRKTWDSIPTKFRPLSARINVIITRNDVGGLAEKILTELRAKSESSNEITDFYSSSNNTSSSIAIKSSTAQSPIVVVTNSIDEALSVETSESFCIGGAEIYSLFLKSETARSSLRILQTEVKKMDETFYDCDTFWPEHLVNGQDNWQEASKDSLVSWINMDTPQGSNEWHKDEKAQVYIRVRGWYQV